MRESTERHYNRGRKLPPEPLSQEEVRRLLKACSRRAPTGVRNAALLAVLWRGGLRCAEALALVPKDVDSDAGTLRVLHGKGDRARVVGLDPAAFALVERWLDRRAQLEVPRGAPVFCTLRGGPLSTSYVRHLMKRLGRRAEIEKRVHPHGLRHTHAAELAGEGVPLHVVQAQLGHSSLAVTSRYVGHLQPQQVIDAMQARRW